MLYQAIDKLEADHPDSKIWVGGDILTSIRDILGDSAGPRADVLEKYGLSGVTLITAH